MPLLRFGTFEIDSNTGELRKSGLLISLPPQPFRILALLASHPGELMTREDIRRQIWDDGTFVDFEQGLNIAINKIRAALGDNAESPVTSKRYRGGDIVSSHRFRLLEIMNLV